MYWTARQLHWITFKKNERKKESKKERSRQSNLIWKPDNFRLSYRCPSPPPSPPFATRRPPSAPLAEPYILLLSCHWQCHVQSVKADIMKIAVNTESHSNLKGIPAANLSIHEPVWIWTLLILLAFKNWPTNNFLIIVVFLFVRTSCLRNCSL
jgi:hypothetical protein